MQNQDSLEESWAGSGSWCDALLCQREPQIPEVGALILPRLFLPILHFSFLI